MEAYDDIRKELEDIAPTLSKMSRANAFKVEDSYFDTLPNLVMDRIHSGKRGIKIDLSWLLQPKWIAGVSFIVITLVTGSIFLFNSGKLTERSMPLAQVHQLLIEPATLDNIVDDLDVETMTDAIAENIKDHKKGAKIPDTKRSDKKALEEYILDNVDDNSIIDEL